MRSPLGKGQIGNFVGAAGKKEGADLSIWSEDNQSFSILLNTAATKVQKFTILQVCWKKTTMVNFLGAQSNFNSTSCSSSSFDNSTCRQICQNTGNNSRDNLKYSSFFSDVYSVKGCIFKNLNGPTHIKKRSPTLYCIDLQIGQQSFKILSKT